MNPSNFDELTKTLAESRSRRQALRVILTASIGGLLGLTSISTVFGKKGPKCHRNGLGCDRNTDCCSQFCFHGKCRCPAAPTCNNVCGCSSGETCCSGTCTDTDTDPNNCGGCGTVCSNGETCQSGTCVQNCTSVGGTCNNANDCCSNMDCPSGNCCIPSNFPGPGDQICTSSTQCCDSGAICENPPSVGVVARCCFPVGASVPGGCSGSDSRCCELTCFNGTCL